MDKLKKMKKEELIKECLRLKQEYEELEQQYDDLDECYAEKENEIEEVLNEKDNIESQIEDGVFINAEKFIFELERQGLMTRELEEFIENYMMFDNE